MRALAAAPWPRSAEQPCGEKPQVPAIALERIAREAVFEPERIAEFVRAGLVSSPSVGAWIFVMQQPTLDVVAAPLRAFMSHRCPGYRPPGGMEQERDVIRAAGRADVTRAEPPAWLPADREHSPRNGADGPSRPWSGNRYQRSRKQISTVEIRSLRYALSCL